MNPWLKWGLIVALVAALFVWSLPIGAVAAVIVIATFAHEYLL